MDKDRLIKDLTVIKQYFMNQSGGCFPLCLEEAINIIKDIPETKGAENERKT